MQLQDQDEWLRTYNLVGGKPRFLFSSAVCFDLLLKRVQAEVPHAPRTLEEQVLAITTNTFNKRMKHIAFSMYRFENSPSMFYVAYSSLAA